jgi:hypothetical protein
MLATPTSRPFTGVEHERAIATILRKRALSKTFKLWQPALGRPATHLMADIFLPRAGNSIAAGQVGVRHGREE